MKIIICIFTILICFNASGQVSAILDVDFMQSMTDGSKKARQLLTSAPEYAHYLKIFQENYEAKKPSKMPYSKEPLIPKIMHQIWIGGSDLPPLYQNYLNECKKLYPNWEFKLWGDKEVADFGLEYQDLYDKMRNIPGKADILRYEILYKFGGVYRDMDVKCLRPMDELNHKYDFYVPLEFPAKSWKMPTINNGIIGSKSGHEILRATLEHLGQNIDAMWGDFDKGDVPNFLKNRNFMTIKISMLPLTHTFIAKSSSRDKGADKGLDQTADKSIALPTTYFLPIGYNHKNERGWLAKLLNLPLREEYFQRILPESLMWHNLDKQEIELIDFDQANGMQDPARKRLKDALPGRFYQAFDELYKSNSRYGFNKNSKVAQVIHFVVFDDANMAELQKHLGDWIMLNRDFEIKIWHEDFLSKCSQTQSVTCQEISTVLPEASLALEKIRSRDAVLEDARFYIGCKAIEKFGGHYADFRATPHKSIFELGNKYNFYAGMMPISKGANRISLSQKLIGASVNSRIISSALGKASDLSGDNFADNLQKFNELLTQEVFLTPYPSRDADIILPAIFMEPLSPLQDDYLYMIPDYLIRFFKNQPKSFIKIDRHAIVQ